MLTLLLTSVLSADLLMALPAACPAPRIGASTSVAGHGTRWASYPDASVAAYVSAAVIAANALSAVLLPLLVGCLAQYMNVCDLQRLAMCGTALVALPRVGCSRLPPSGAYMCEHALVAAERVPQMAFEQSAAILLLRLFQRPSEFRHACGAIVGMRYHALLPEPHHPWPIHPLRSPSRCYHGRLLVGSLVAPLGVSLCATIGSELPHAVASASLVLIALLTRLTVGKAHIVGGSRLGGARFGALRALLATPALGAMLGGLLCVRLATYTMTRVWALQLEVAAVASDLADASVSDAHGAPPIANTGVWAGWPVPTIVGPDVPLGAPWATLTLGATLTSCAAVAALFCCGCSPLVACVVRTRASTRNLTTRHTAHDTRH
jgi:hypothetical protein